MYKLYPPSIEGKLPACAGSSLVIPFTMNKTVNENQIGAIAAIIKTISTGRVVANLTKGTLVKNNKGYVASFDNEKENGQIAKLTNGQYYKVQIAYITKNNTIGYYSSVGTFKRTTIPQVKVPALEGNFYSGYEYIGTYSQEGSDETEKVYSYCFELTDMDGNIIDTSGIQIHNGENDTETNKSQDAWKSNIELDKNVPYYLIYKVTTMNGLECISPRYITMNQDSIDIDLDIELQSRLNIDDGCIELYITPSGEKNLVISGSFVLVRSSNKNNFNIWEEVYKFSYLNMSLTKKNSIKLWEDCTIEQGEEYLYAIQAYNSRNLYSNRLNAKNGKIKADFIDAFLYDGKRQLKIQFNPKVSNLKNNILETKMDTIGSKYPFIFRNGYVHYKEFSISGLISLLSDESGKFLNTVVATQVDDIRIETPASNINTINLQTNLSSENIYNERQFKLEVLEWLNNGQPKIFRSPTEGNYIVRLMNVSLSPLDTLGRMLHTFQCTAYEIAEWNFKNLINLNLITLPDNQTSNIKIAQIQPKQMIEVQKQSLAEFKNQYSIFDLYNDYKSISFGKEAYGLNITEATPGTILQFTFSKSSADLPTVLIEIGGTGAYYVQTREYGVTGLQLVSGGWDDLKITFEYYDNTPTDAFNNIANLTLTDEIRRFIGPGYNLNIPARGSVANQNHIISDIRRDVGNFHYIRVEKRYIQEIWPTTIDGKICYSRNEAFNDIIKDNEWNPVIIYYNHGDSQYYNGNMKNKMSEPDFRFRLNSPNENVYVDLGYRTTEENPFSKFGSTFGRIDAIYNIGIVENLQIGSGLIADVAYRVRTKEYVVESEDPDTIAAKAEWEKAKSEVDSAISHHQTTEYIQNAINNAHNKYNVFITKLKIALQRKGVEV